MAFKFVLLACLISLSSAAFQADAPYYAQVFATGLAQPRGLYVDTEGDLLVLSRGSANIVALWTTANANGTETVNRATIVNAGNSCNHGLTYHNGYVYASSPTAVYRWPYVAGSRQLVTTPPQIIINNIAGGGHVTRTIIFDVQNRLYVSIGSQGNVDQTPQRSRIRRFNLGDDFPINFLNGEVFADGLRNEVGLAFDEAGILWGVENGVDNANRPDLGGDIHNGNPSEEMNKFDGPVATFYGYPYCFSSYNLLDFPAGTQFAWNSFMPQYNDSFCRDASFNKPPAFNMAPHMAPLGIQFLGESCDSGEGSFPCSMRGDAVVALHGSWNSNIPVGYKVQMYGIDSGTQLPNGEITDIIYENNIVPGCGSCIRPVNAVFNSRGHLIISDDRFSQLYRVTYNSPPPIITQNSGVRLSISKYAFSIPIMIMTLFN